MGPDRAAADDRSPVQSPDYLSRALGRAQVGGGYLLMVVGGLLVFGGFSGLRPSVHKSAWPYLVGVLLAVAGALTLLLATKLLRQGRKHLVSILSLGTVPAGDFVIYLRSFTDDTRLTKVKLAQRSSTGPPVTVAVPRTEEEQLRAAVRPFGQLVAVGRPGEALPELGAQRGYLRGDSWQDAVVAMMREARLVLLVAGLSQSLRWEMATAVANVSPQQLVLLIPMGTEEYEVFRRELAETFPRGLPSYPQGKRSDKYRHRIAGAIHFDDRWIPRFVRFDLHSSRGNQFRPVESYFVYGLRPVYERLGAEWPGLDHIPWLPKGKSRAAEILRESWPPEQWPMREQLPRYYFFLGFTTLSVLATLVVIMLAIITS